MNFDPRNKDTCLLLYPAKGLLFVSGLLKPHQLEDFISSLRSSMAQLDVRPPEMRKGDTVRCIDAIGSVGMLIDNQEYTVERERSTGVLLRGVSGDWNKKRFRLIGGENTPDKPEENSALYKVRWVFQKLSYHVAMMKKDGQQNLFFSPTAGQLEQLAGELGAAAANLEENHIALETTDSWPLDKWSDDHFLYVVSKRLEAHGDLNLVKRLGQVRDEFNERLEQIKKQSSNINRLAADNVAQAEEIADLRSKNEAAVTAISKYSDILAAKDKEIADLKRVHGWAQGALPNIDGVAPVVGDRILLVINADAPSVNHFYGSPDEPVALCGAISNPGTLRDITIGVKEPRYCCSECLERMARQIADLKAKNIELAKIWSKAPAAPLKWMNKVERAGWYWWMSKHQDEPMIGYFHGAEGDQRDAMRYAGPVFSPETPADGPTGSNQENASPVGATATKTPLPGNSGGLKGDSPIGAYGLSAEGQPLRGQAPLL